MHSFAIICLAFVLTVGGSEPQTSEPLCLQNVRVLDVDSGELSAATTVVIRQGTIAAIGPQAQVPAGVKALDLQGHVLMPGLMDLHSHLLLHPYNEASWNDQVLKESLGLRTIRGTVHARKTLEAGFTTIRELGTEGADYADVAIRDSIQQGLIPGPRVLTATRALVTSGGYGPSGFDPRFRIPKGAQQADGVAEVRRATREQIAAGADWIKVYADYRRKSGDRSTPTFSQAEIEAIVDEANSAGVKVSAHATTNRGIRRAVNAGVATIEHGYEASLTTLQLMREKGVVLCPTLSASEAMARYSGWEPGESDHARIKLAKTLMKHVVTSGVTVACGSDVGVFAHGDNARELELMFAYGMAPDEVLRSATTTAAKVIGMESQLGKVKVGFVADLIVVKSNPVNDLGVLRKPILVIQNGRIAADFRGR